MSTAAVALPRRWGTAWRRPAAGAAAAGVALLAIARWGLTGHGLVMAFTSAVLVVLSVIDVERRILPNVIVLPAAALVLITQVALDPARASEYLIASFAASGLLLVLFLVNPRGMGMGDVKLAFLLGAALGRQVAIALVVGPLFVAPLGLVMVARRGRGAGSMTVPLGPFLALGALIAAYIAT